MFAIFLKQGGTVPGLPEMVVTTADRVGAVKARLLAAANCDTAADTESEWRRVINSTNPPLKYNVHFSS